MHGNYASGTVDAMAKGVGALARDDKGSTPGWRLLEGDVALPAAILSDSRVEHNLRWMQRFVETYGLKLAPHGKTTMAPKLFRRQIAGGAWGITVATAQQARVAALHGVTRILMANQLIGAANIAMIADLVADPALNFVCLVDSVEGVAALGEAFRARRGSVQVLLELAPTADQGGYRAGVRDDAGLAQVRAALAEWALHVRLVGVEVYEGVLRDEGEIRTFLRRAVAVARQIAQAEGFARRSAILSGAGSAWYDVVAEEFAKAEIGMPIDIVLRPGCYLSHDVGIYAQAQDDIMARNPIAAAMRGGLLPALQLWAYVQSIPDPSRAIVALGKRDAAFDAGLPMPTLTHRPGTFGLPVAAPDHWRVTGMMDQHAYLDIAPGDDLRVGDMIAFDISHPCLTFDKWRHILLVDDAYRCIDVIQTYF